MKALLLCAGKGSRFKPYSFYSPKPALPFLNTPVVSWPLNLLESLNTKSLIVNTHHHPRQTKTLIKNLKPKIKTIHFSHEETLLGGAGTVKQNQAFLKDSESFIYLNGDSIFLVSGFFEDMKKAHFEKKALVTLLAGPFKKTSALNPIFADSKNQIIRKGEGNPPRSLKSYFFSGFALFSPKCFEFLKPNAKNIFQDLIFKAPEKCFVFVKPDLEFFEAGSLNWYLHSTKKILQNLNQDGKARALIEKTLLRWLSSYRFFKDPKTNALVFCGKNVKGMEHLRFKNFAVIGENTVFTKDTLIEGAVIAPGARPVKNILANTLVMEKEKGS